MSGYTSLCLKLVGVVFVLSFFLDTITFAVPFNWQSDQWQINLVTTVVERGVVPLVGISIILIAYWIDGASGIGQKSSPLNLKLPTYIVASLLGLIFLLLVPVHLNNLNQAKTNALEKIEQGVGQGEQQIQSFLAQLNSISRNPQQIAQQVQQRQQIIETGQYQGQQLTAEQLESLKRETEQLRSLSELAKNPTEFKKKVEETKTRLQEELANRKRKAEGQAKTEALKQGLRIGLSSLMLAIVYSAIGWLGLQGLKIQSPPKDPRL